MGCFFLLATVQKSIWKRVIMHDDIVSEYKGSLPTTTDSYDRAGIDTSEHLE